MYVLFPKLKTLTFPSNDVWIAFETLCASVAGLTGIYDTLLMTTGL